MILYAENQKGSTKKNLLELISEFKEAVGYKINTWKSVVFLCTNNELPERKSKKPTLFKITSKKNKIPRNKLNQGGEGPILWKIKNTDERNWRWSNIFYWILSFRISFVLSLGFI